MLVTVFALLLAGQSSSQVVVVAAPSAPAEARRSEEEAPTRRVCRLERATGSNMQQRVCRDVARSGNFQDQQTREFMRSHQRIRFPDGGAAPTPAGPNG